MHAQKFAHVLSLTTNNKKSSESMCKNPNELVVFRLCSPILRLLLFLLRFFLPWYIKTNHNELNLISSNRSIYRLHLLTFHFHIQSLCVIFWSFYSNLNFFPYNQISFCVCVCAFYVLVITDPPMDSTIHQHEGRL